MKLVEYNENSSKSVITSAAGQSRSNIIIDFVNDDHEEADTLMILSRRACDRAKPDGNFKLVFISSYHYDS